MAIRPKLTHQIITELKRSEQSITGLTLCFLFLLMSHSTSASTQLIHVPSSIIPEVVSDPTPDAFTPGPLNDEDFTLTWLGPPIEGFEAHLGLQTTEWVRVLDTLVVPRARFILNEAPHPLKDSSPDDSGEILYAGFIQPLQKLQGHLHAELPIVLLSGEKNPIQIHIKRHNQIFQGTLILKFTPRPKLLETPENRFYIDANCSSFHVSPHVSPQLPSLDPPTINNTLSAQLPQTAHWASVGCHLVKVKGENARAPSLEIFVLWDQGEQEIKIEGIPTRAPSTSLWPLRLNAQNDHVSLKNQQKELTLNYQIPVVLKNGAMGLGLGPYAFHFEGNGDALHTVTALATLYSSYAFGETFKLVSFGLFTTEQHTYADVGLYGRIENFRLLDRRLGVHLLIGGHAIAIQSKGQIYGGFSLPQGFELIFTDAFKKSADFKLGAFLYPPIDGGSYYNVWLRWGGAYFVELNYIAWSNTFKQVAFHSSSMGITFGMPIFKF